MSHKLILLDGTVLWYGHPRELAAVVDAEDDDWTTHEMHGPDEDMVEGVFVKGELIGFIDDEPVGDISQYETWDQMELRQAREEAERDAKAEYALEDRRDLRRAG
jgi:hypothetical protein